ncbi:phytanoyl-CoA dioxygenase family protein [Paenibacillus mendelii]|uniref:Phytanoyl-CoA dioxygenase family protein n=1 Tax=Paenibacillus mendelii TaxID=206163 RepID=A0ABV6JG56_9BACL|nr:phytanoyl-CoA dioxygenase family protein [Paenibacillus mendelii]MCQ6557782.1 phytanoyl-CoA dioxygenase family protein [Paenibacillus mendelii]
MQSFDTETLDRDRLVEQFREYGYVIVKNVLSSQTVNRLNAAIDEVGEGHPDSEPNLDIRNAIERHAAFLELIDEPTVLPIVMDILGRNIQLHTSHLTVRKPLPRLNGQPQPPIGWHADGPVPSFPAVNGLTPLFYMKALYFLSDMSQPGRGNTRVMPKSHKIPHYHPGFSGSDPQTEGVDVCGKPGDVCLFAQNLWHAPTHNYSEFTRRQLFMGYGYLWLRPIDYHAVSDTMRQITDPVRRQLLGLHEGEPFRFYVPDSGKLPLNKL